MNEQKQIRSNRDFITSKLPNKNTDKELKNPQLNTCQITTLRTEKLRTREKNNVRTNCNRL